MVLRGLRIHRDRKVNMNKDIIQIMETITKLSDLAAKNTEVLDILYERLTKLEKIVKEMEAHDN